MNLGTLGEDLTVDYGNYEYPTDPYGNALVQTPGTVAVQSNAASTWNWSAFFQPFATVASTLITQNATTTRQQNAIAAGQAGAVGQSTVLGIPVVYLLIGAAVVVMVKK